MGAASRGIGPPPLRSHWPGGLSLIRLRWLRRCHGGGGGGERGPAGGRGAPSSSKGPAVRGEARPGRSGCARLGLPPCPCGARFALRGGPMAARGRQVTGGGEGAAGLRSVGPLPRGLRSALPSQEPAGLPQAHRRLLSCNVHHPFHWYTAPAARLRLPVAPVVYVNSKWCRIGTSRTKSLSVWTTTC